MRQIDVTADYQPLSAVRTVASVTVSCPPTNSDPVYFRGDQGDDVPWLPGEWHVLARIDLAELFVKGTIGDVVTAIGGTW